MTSLPRSAFQPQDATERVEEGSPLREVLLILRRRRWLIIWIMLLLTTIATLTGLQITKTYTATALVMIEPRLNRVVDIEAVTQGYRRNYDDRLLCRSGRRHFDDPRDGACPI